MNIPLYYCVFFTRCS